MTEAGRKYGFETLQIHAGARPDPATGARQTPIYQTTAYVFRDSEHAAALFDLKEIGFIYSRLTNPTVAVLQERIATLEGGIGAVCCSTGHAAQILALFPLMSPGCNVIASNRLYGGTVTQFNNTIRRFDWSSKLVDFDDLDAVRAAIDDDTRAVFCESISNPGGYVTDIPAISEIAAEMGLPLIVDNTSATPYLCQPISMGATLVVHSTTKYLTGNGTVTGGMRRRQRQFRLDRERKFPGALGTRARLSRSQISRDIRTLCLHAPQRCGGPARSWHDNEPAGGSLYAYGDRDFESQDAAPRGKRACGRAMAGTAVRGGRGQLCRASGFELLRAATTRLSEGRGGAVYRTPEGGVRRLRQICRQS